jgi:glycine/D-amino acid oxidase-like deaminating enzyme
VNTHSIVHATNAHVSHLLPKMRKKILPVRAAMSAQRPGQTLNASTLDGRRSFTFIGASNGFDYMTQLPTGEQELMFGGGIGHAGNEGLAEVGIAQDNCVNSEVAAYLNGAIPSLFGLENWGAECPVDPKTEGKLWHLGRTKALWSGTIGWSADGLPWVGRVPDKVSGRTTSRSKKLTGEWIAAGFTGEGMTSAWMCGRALGMMMLANDDDLKLDWFPSPLRVTERRWKAARPEDQLDYDWGH